MPKASRKAISQPQPALTPAVPALPTTAPVQRKRSATLEEAHLKKTALYFTIGLCSCSELASIAAFFFTRNVEATFIFQLPALACFYRILCYLYPTNDTSSHPLVALVQALWKHK